MIIYYHKWAVTYKVANDYLALSMAGDRLSRGLLGSCGAGLSRVLLDTTDRRSGGGTSGRTTLASTAIANGTSLSREDLVKRLVELARHVDFVVVLVVFVVVVGLMVASAKLWCRVADYQVAYK